MNKVLSLVLVSFAGASMSIAAAQESPTDEAKRTITVSGRGEVVSVPDTASVQLGVETEAEEASRALADNNRLMKDLLETCKKFDIPERQIQTSNFNVSPKYSNRRPGNEALKIEGYRVSNQVTVKIEDLNRLGALLDAVIQAGANRVQGVGFEIGDPSKLLDEARRKAVEDAIHRAEILAAAAGIELGGVLTISEAQTDVRPVGPTSMRMMEAASVPISQGEQSLTAQVMITFAIADAK